MGLPALLSTPLDARNLSEYITTGVRDDARIQQFILRTDPIIKDSLRPLYTIPDNINESAPWNGPPQPKLAIQEITANTGSASLLDITVDSSAVTEMWTLAFTSETAYNITGSVSGSQGTGATGSNSSSTNSYITIPSANWLGTAASGDEFYISVYKAKPLIVSVSAYLSAALALKGLFEGNDGTSEKAQELEAQGKELLKGLMEPYEDHGIQLDSFSPRDITPEGTQYSIDLLGRDIAKYSDNEQTDWNDATTGGTLMFFLRPVW